MIGTPFLLGPAERIALQELRAKAAAAPVDMPGLMARIKTGAGKKRHMRRMTAQTIMLPVAYAVTFSFETGHPAGVARHLSMSVKRDGRLPLPETVWMVAKELGFTGGLRECQALWLEDLEGHGQAVNVVQIITAAAGTGGGSA